MRERGRTPNRLAGETSPYLQQHAHNPVDWNAWGPEALERARREDKAILLSIGYAACHWCHVMAHECFEDEVIAALMNEHFVCIKVDREERPDLDHIYQLAHQLLTGRGGGWPLTAFLAPDGRPFFAGTYFPPTSRQGLPGFLQVLEAVRALYAERRGAVAGVGRRVVEALDAVDASARRPDDPDPLALDSARRALGRVFDPLHGGTRGAPKFPQAGHLELLARREATHPDDDEARSMRILTLRRMADGGIHDQLGGGFFRYAVDESWTIPHFEKMLYDNAQLLRAYTDGFRATGDEVFRGAALDTAEWALREMRLPGGAFASSLDADSGGEEGGSYVWPYEEVRALLLPDELAVASLVYGISREGNFGGRSHLVRRMSAAEAAGWLGQGEAATERLMESARAKLREARAQRLRPGMDDKVLASWNALLAGALARAGRVFERSDLVDAATGAIDFLRRELWMGGRLFASWRDGRATHPAYLDDHAFLLDALLEVLRARWRGGDLRWATELADELCGRFEDREAGGFYFTAADHEELIHRPKTAADSALPSGNGVAAQALLRMGWLLGRSDWLAAAERAIRAFAGPLREAPLAHPALLGALEDLSLPVRLAVLRGAPEALTPWRRAAGDGGERDAVFVIPAGEELPEALAAKRPLGDAVAYVCRGMNCSLPLSDLEAFRRAWEAGLAGA
ncbi:MAG: thioredoxin domain-containing protein [Deltaproteobacteria bacterium]|nr:thioredoxin domain-containing protein [Deltaproteobacteria bacterium]